MYGWFGLVLLAVSEVCLFCKIEPFLTWFYCFAWWSYILVADALVAKLRGRSLLSGRRSEFWGMLALSVFVWSCFEAGNFVLHNWSYTRIPSEIWQRWPGYALAFATVVPAVFITSDLVELLFGRQKRPAASECEILPAGPRPRGFPLLIFLGLALTAASLVFPRYAFPALWLGPIFVFDPMLEKAGIRSLSLSLRYGDFRRTWSLMLGGLLCGLMWEFWNYWAGSKWIYTVPFFSGWKLFEMPVLGFAGFPPFALECWILYHLLRAIPTRLHSPAGRIAWWLGLGIVCILIFRGIDNRTVIRFA
jgi:hypothetical protein